MFLVNVSLSVLLLLLLVGAAAAQQPTFRSQSNVVLVPALVKDKNGDAVYGLEAKDFVIQDDGVEQAVHLDEAAESEPVAVVIAVQRGRSADREFARMRGLTSLLEPIVGQEQTQVALVEFDSQVQLTRYFTQDGKLITADLQNLRSGDGGAAILDAVNYSVKLLDKVPEGRQRVLLLISETRDHGSRSATIEDVVTSIGNGNTVVYTLAFSPSASNVLDTLRGSNQDQMNARPDLLAPLLLARQAMRKNTPKTIARMTGGDYELFKSRKNFEKRMLDFTNHLHSRYLLSFEPKNPHPGLHQIRVQLRDPGNVIILARSSYWALGTPQ